MGKVIDKSEFWYIKDNPITKTGVFPYLGAQIGQHDLEPNKIYYVLRPAEELFKPETVESFNGLPITIEHAMLGPETQGLTKPEDKGIDGVTLESAHQSGDKLLNNIRLFSEQIKDAVNSGKKELSAGYYCDFVPESGTYNGQHYDFVQRNIFGNHIALVDKGRSGSDIRVMDNAIKGRIVYDTMDLGTFTQDWEESDHPRKKDGKFTNKGSGSASSSKSDTQSGKKEKQTKDIRTNKPKLADKNETIKPVEIDKTVPHFNSFSELKQYIFNELNVLGDVEIKDAGTTIHFGKDQVKRALKRGRSDTQNQFFADVKNSVANAKYGGFQKSDERHPEVAGQDIYYTAIKIGKDVYAIKLSADVQHNHSDNKYSYAGHHLENIKKYQESDTGVSPVNALPDTISIAQFEEIFNSKQDLQKESEVKPMDKKTQDAWEESKHPRDNDGKFSSGNGGGKSGISYKSNSLAKEHKENKIKLQKSENGKGYVLPSGEVVYPKDKGLLKTRLKEDSEMLSDAQEKLARYKKVAEARKEHNIKTPWPFTDTIEDVKGSIDYLKQDSEYTKELLKEFEKTNGASGQDTAPEQEEGKMDKREVVREIMAICAKPDTDFQGGEEEKIDTVAKLAEKIAYNPSEAGANDKCASDKEEDKKPEAGAELPKAVAEPEKVEEEKEEDKIKVAMDAMAKSIMKEMAAKNELVSALKPVIGAFDSAEMTLKEVASYACKKLNITCAQDEALTMVKGYLLGKKQDVIVKPASAQDSALDGEDAALKRYLEGK